jgi:hypothetical protein
MKYEEMVKKVANSDRTTMERGDMVIRDTTKVIDAIMDYRYAVERYKGDTETVIYDKVMSIKNAVAILESDLDIYKDVLGITGKVADKKKGRITKIINKIDSYM